VIVVAPGTPHRNPWNPTANLLQLDVHRTQYGIMLLASLIHRNPFGATLAT